MLSTGFTCKRLEGDQGTRSARQRRGGAPLIKSSPSTTQSLRSNAAYYRRH